MAGAYPSVTVLHNAFWNNGAGITGGDEISAQMFRRLRPSLSHLRCYTSVDGRATLEPMLPKTEFVVTGGRASRMPLLLAYLLRTVRACWAISFRPPDVVYSGSDFFPDVLPAILCKALFPRTRWVQCVFHIYPSWRVRPGSRLWNFGAALLQRFSLWIARRADAVVVLNAGTRVALGRLGYDLERIVVHRPGVDAEFLQSFAPLSDTPAADAVFVGRLVPSKGIFDLVRIWALVVQQFPDATLTLVGNGSPAIRSRLTRELAARGLERRVRLAGFLPHEEIFRMLKRSRLFLFSSHEEGYGIAIAEALACGIPVVAWDLPVYAEVFGDAIVRVESFDIPQFAKTVCRLLRDEALRRDFSERARRAATRFSWDRELPVYKRALALTEQTHSP